MALRSPFAPEPPYTHGQAAKTAVLFCNLGTPDAPTATAVRRYLAEFLSDSRVVEIPKLLWQIILHGIVLRTRPAKSAAKYASIWTDQGSPLKLWTERQARLLETNLRGRGHDVLVRFAMRYGSHSVPEQLQALKADGVVRVLVLPAYPQYSATTSASVFDAVYTWAAQTRRIPELRFINHYHDHAAYIQALAESVRRYWREHGQPDQLLMSFHGVPERTLHLGDPYHCESRKTARLLAEALHLTSDQYQISFQSRLGRAKWLEPYTEQTLRSMGQAGIQRVDVVCPGFTSDCLETLEEIAIEGRDTFLAAGGQSFHYIPCLNDSPQWIDALAEISQQHLAGWPTESKTETQLAREQSRQRAAQLGSPR